MKRDAPNQLLYVYYPIRDEDLPSMVKLEAFAEHVKGLPARRIRLEQL